MPHLASLSPWGRYAPLLAAGGVGVVVVSAVLEAVGGGGWVFMLGYTVLYTSIFLTIIAVLSLVFRLRAPREQRTWIGVWKPLAAVAANVVLANMYAAVAFAP